MGAIRYNIFGSDYVGAFAACTERYIFIGSGIGDKAGRLMEETLDTQAIPMQVCGTDFIGVFCRANSNGIAVSELAYADDLRSLKGVDLKIQVIDSDLNAIGNNVLANDKIAVINPDYSRLAEKQIADALDVEIIRASIGGYKTVGANNILTNKGMLINNRSTDTEKEQIDKLTTFDSIRTTANTGSVAIGLSVLANSKGIVAGNTTTGYELVRIMQGLELE